MPASLSLPAADVGLAAAPADPCSWKECDLPAGFPLPSSACALASSPLWSPEAPADAEEALPAAAEAAEAALVLEPDRRPASLAL